MRMFSILCLLLAVSFNGYAQAQLSDKDALTRGKTLIQQGSYDMAMDVLHSLSQKSASPYAAYACYYYAVAAYKKDFYHVALEMINFLIQKYPKWNNIDEAKLWQVQLFLADKNYENAIQAIATISGSTVKKSAENLYLSEVNKITDYYDLAALYRNYPENRYIGQVLADRIILQPLMLRDSELLVEIASRFDLDPSKYKTDTAIEGVKKDEYRIAVLLPFMSNEIIPGKSGRSNQFIYDIYQGILIGNEQLGIKGIKLRVLAYDTRKSGVETRKLIDAGELNGNDVIIGPLYADEVQIINEYSIREQVTVINPLSSNSEIVKQNPFALLFRASLEREAEEAAGFALQNFQKNKNYFIFYGQSPRDSLNAITYKSILDSDSFNLNFIHRVSSRDTDDIYSILTRKVKLKDLHLPLEDSLRLLSHYSFDFEALEEAEKKIEDQEIFIMHPDSIGHVLGASSNELIATSLISGVETRADHTYIVGNEDWLDIRQLSLEQLGRLNVVLTAPGYIDLDNHNLERINNFIIDKTHAPPNKYHYLGYEIITYLGYMLEKYGSPFLMGLKKEGFYPGVIFYGFDYSEGRDNNVVPIIKFVENDFVIVNNPARK